MSEPGRSVCTTFHLCGEKTLMPRRILVLATSLVLVLATGACGLEPTQAPAPSWLRASLTGSVEAQFEGTGDFAPLRDDAESPYYMRISAVGTGSSTGGYMTFRSNNAARPAPGTYPLVSHETIHGSSRGWTGVYRFPAEAGSRALGALYVAQAGTITITRSTPEVMEGTFRFTGVRVDESPASRYAPDPNAPTAAASGSFQLTFFDEDKQTGYAE